MVNRCATNCGTTIQRAQDLRQRDNATSVRDILIDSQPHFDTLNQSRMVSHSFLSFRLFIFSHFIGNSPSPSSLPSHSECVTAWNRAAGIQFLRLGLALFDQKVMYLNRFIWPVRAAGAQSKFKKFTLIRSRLR